jgi:predicted RNA-binding protein YlxR (DUF448 family)
MYRLGFRALEEVSEASVEELAAIPGLGGADVAERIKTQADDDHGAAAPRAHPRRLAHRAAHRARAPHVRARHRRAHGRLLEEAGYKTVEDVLREDEDRLAIRSGLGIKKAAASSKPPRSSSTPSTRSRSSRANKRTRGADAHVPMADAQRVARLIEANKSARTSGPPEEGESGAFHAPHERTCVGCGERCAPGELIRLVLAPSGEIAVDAAGGGFGRGAHVHARGACLRQAATRGLLRATKPERRAA